MAPPWRCTTRLLCRVRAANPDSTHLPAAFLQVATPQLEHLPSGIAPTGQCRYPVASRDTVSREAPTPEVVMRLTRFAILAIALCPSVCSAGVCFRDGRCCLCRSPSGWRIVECDTSPLVDDLLEPGERGVGNMAHLSTTGSEGGIPWNGLGAGSYGSSAFGGRGSGGIGGGPLWPIVGLTPFPGGPTAPSGPGVWPGGPAGPPVTPPVPPTDDIVSRPIPEPSSIVLWILALGMIAAYVLRRARK